MIGKKIRNVLLLLVLALSVSGCSFTDFVRLFGGGSSNGGGSCRYDNPYCKNQYRDDDRKKHWDRRDNRDRRYRD